jgi:hypothetical protein
VRYGLQDPHGATYVVAYFEGHVASQHYSVLVSPTFTPAHTFCLLLAGTDFGGAGSLGRSARLPGYILALESI